MAFWATSFVNDECVGCSSVIPDVSSPPSLERVDLTLRAGLVSVCRHPRWLSSLHGARNGMIYLRMLSLMAASVKGSARNRKRNHGRSPESAATGRMPRGISLNAGQIYIRIYLDRDLPRLRDRYMYTVIPGNCDVDWLQAITFLRRSCCRPLSTATRCCLPALPDNSLFEDHTNQNTVQRKITVITTKFWNPDHRRTL